jgi:hypothetical protein
MRASDTTMKRRTPFGGWRLIGITASVVALAVAARLLMLGSEEAGIRGGIRSTAQISLILFVAAFVAAPLQRLRPGAAGRWLVRNRRYLGLSFAVSHFTHLVLIVILASISADFRLDTATLVGGGFTYVLIAAMAATSFDRSAAWLGPRWWRRLHATGMYSIWTIFFLSYAPRAAAPSAFYAPFALSLVAAMGLRWLGRRGRRRETLVTRRSVQVAGA